MSKFHLLTILLLLHLQHLLVAVGFELAGVPPDSHHGDQQLPRCHEDEGAALLEFRSSFGISQDCLNDMYEWGYNNEYTKLEQWKIGSNCCTWDGIECDVRDGRIIGLDLSNTCLSGSINSTSTLFRLLHLQRLSLAFINFNHSQIPSTIGHFSRLTSLNLSSCSLAGPIPSQLLSLTNLTTLDLSSNDNLVLSQNPSFENLTRSLTKLEQLILAGINISSLLPDRAFTNLTSLKVLDITNCRLTWELPSSIFKLPKLQFLAVSYNPELSVHLPEFQPGSPLQRLFLYGVSISGGLPNSLGNLASLTELDVYSPTAKLKLGGFPSSIFNLTKLTSLTLSSCEINGPLPSSFGYLTQLYSLDLSQNQLTGHIPSSFRDLINLMYLNLGSNQLTGEVPSHIFGLTNLTILDLSDNKLQGTVQLDNVFLGLKLLNILSLSSNNLSVVITTKSNATANHSIQLDYLSLGSCKLREFPEPFLRNQETLIYLDLSDNQLHGVIPTWFFNVSFRGLMYLNLSRNFLTSFPQNYSVLFEWPNLETLDLSFNKLHGSIPLVPQSTNIITYDVSNNYLSGEIPPLICIPNSSPTHLDLSNNNFTGVIPQCIVNSTYTLEVLSLKGNNFVGKIPEMGAGRCEELRMIDLSNNQLVGQLPRSLSSCFRLEYLNFGNNMLSDTFPSWLGSLGELTVLILRSNKLHGVIQDVEEGLEFPLLQIIDLSQNYLEGHLPSKLFKSWNSTRTPHGYFGTTEFDEFSHQPVFYYYTMILTNKGNKLEYPRIFAFLKAIDLSSNNFSGSIPSSFADIRGLQLLNLSNNHLVGPIPPFLGGLTDLQALDLARNSLSGGIPQQLVQLNFLAFFNVSDNNLSGSIPQGYQFNTFGDASYQGNEGLCGAPLSRDCGNSLEPPVAEVQDEEVSVYIEWKAVVVGYASAFIVAALIGHHKITVRQNWFVIISRLREQGRGRWQRQR